MDDVEDVGEPSEAKLEKSFKKFLDQASEKRPSNDKRKAEA